MEHPEIEELINSKFETNNEQHKNILARVDYSIAMSNQMLKQHEDWLKSLDTQVKVHGKTISFAKGLVSIVSILSALAAIAILFIPH